MTDDAALLEAIRLHPDEDMPRLAYADWLEEDGQPERAEFIRVQVKLDRLATPEMKADRRWRDMRYSFYAPIDAIRHREYDLWREHGPMFAADLPGESRACLPGCQWSAGIGDQIQYWFNRGFVWKAMTTANRWLIHADAITAAHPIQRVTLTTRLYWQMRNYNAVLSDQVNFGPESRLCKPMHPDEIDRALRKGIDVALRHEWPGIAIEMPAELRAARWDHHEPMTAENVQRRLAADGTVDIHFGETTYTYRR
jgi:uncharacterized protein (TIGR02996 family)